MEIEQRAKYLEGFAFQYLEIKCEKYGNIKICAKKKSGNLDKTSFDKNTALTQRGIAEYCGMIMIGCISLR